MARRIPLPRPRPQPQEFLQSLLGGTVGDMPESFGERFPDPEDFEPAGVENLELLTAMLHPKLQQQELGRNTPGMWTGGFNPGAVDTDEVLEQAKEEQLEPIRGVEPRLVDESPQEYINMMFPDFYDAFETPQSMIDYRWPSGRQYFKTEGQIIHAPDELSMTEGEAKHRVGTNIRQFMGGDEAISPGMAPETRPGFIGKYLRRRDPEEIASEVFGELEMTPFDKIQRYIGRMFGR